MSNRGKPVMYGLSTCGWCAKARAWLDENAETYDLVYVDLVAPSEREEALARLGRHVSPVAFPVICFGDKCVVGYRPDQYAEQLGVRNED